MNEDKATRYQRQKRHAQAASSAAGVALLAVLVLSGASFWLRPLGPVAAPAALAILLAIVTLPFHVYRDWTLDRRYGLERIPFRVWLATHVKSTLIGIPLGIGAFLILQLAVDLSRAWWWLITALVLAGAQMIVTMAVPWLLPFFAVLRPLPSVRRPLGERLDRLAARAGARGALPVYEWGDQAALRRAQAALVGLGRTRRVLLSGTLLEAFAEEEIEVIVAHELGHHVHRDLWTGAIGRFVTLAIGLALADFTIGAARTSGTALASGMGLTSGTGLISGMGLAGLTGPADVAALPLILLIAGGAGLVTSPLVLAVARRQERRADAFSLDLTGNPDAFISVIRRMAALNLAEERPSQMAVLFASHPSVSARVAAARAWRPSPRARQRTASSADV